MGIWAHLGTLIKSGSTYTPVYTTHCEGSIGYFTENVRQERGGHRLHFDVQPLTS